MHPPGSQAVHTTWGRVGAAIGALRTTESGFSPGNFAARPRSERALRAAKSPNLPRRTGRILARTTRAFFADKLSRLGAALAFVLATALFALIFKLLPAAPMKWRHVWLGAAVTALLFSVGKWALGLHLGRGTVTSAYGAAGSAIALLIGRYYAAQIAFLGAEFTRITSRSDGGRDFAPPDAPAEQERN